MQTGRWLANKNNCAYYIFYYFKPAVWNLSVGMRVLLKTG